MGPEIGNAYSNLVMFLKNVDSRALDTEIKLNVGQIIKAQVISKEGGLYLLKSGDKRFYAKAENTLDPGQRILLEVLGSRDETIVLRKVDNLPLDYEEKEDDPVKSIMKKFGITTEKDVQQVQLALKNIPCEPAAAVKYILDPHLLMALFLPTNFQKDDYHKIEVNQYKSTQKNQDVFEIALELEFSYLGHLEITVKSVEGTIYTRIWAGSKDTAEFLESQLEGLQEICPHIELIPVKQGPLIIRDIMKKVDVLI